MSPSLEDVSVPVNETTSSALFQSSKSYSKDPRLLDLKGKSKWSENVCDLNTGVATIAVGDIRGILFIIVS